MAKNKGGRPIKLSEKWIQMAEKVLEGDIVQWEEEDDEGKIKTKQRKINEYRAIFLTDEELVQIINDKLETIGEEELIFDYRTFARYKAAYFNEESEEGEKTNLSKKQSELFGKFCHLIKKHLAKQKQALFQGLVDESLWQKYAWIIERKFEAWNLKKITDNTHKGADGKPLFNKITVEVVEPTDQDGEE